MNTSELEKIQKQAKWSSAISVLGILILVIAYSIGFFSYKKMKETAEKEQQAMKLQKAELIRDIDSLAKARDFMAGELSKRISQDADNNKTDAPVEKVEILNNTIVVKTNNQSTGLKPDVNQVVTKKIEEVYQPKSQKDQRTKVILFAESNEKAAFLEKQLEKSGFNVIGKSSKLGTPINSVWYSEDVSIEKANEVALILLKNKIKVVAVRPSQKNTTKNTIQIGSTKSFELFESLTPKQIEANKSKILISTK